MDFTDVVRRAIREDKISEKKLVEGDIIIEKSGGTKDHPVGRVVYFPVVEGTYLCNNFTQVLRPDKEVVAPRFLFYTLRAFYDMKVTESLYNKTTGIQNLQMKKYLQLEIPLPPLPAQREIAAELDRICAMKKNAEERVEICQQLVKSKFVECFGDPGVNPMRWPIVSVGDLSAKEKNAFKAGPFGSSLKKEYYVASGYKIYGQEQVIAGDPDLGNYYIDESRYMSLESCKVKSGDLLVSLVGTYGKTLIIPEKYQPGIINPRLLKLTFDQTKIRPDFFQQYFALPSTKSKLDRDCHGCTMGVLNLGVIKSHKLPLPPLPLQREFAAYVAKVEKMEAVAREMVMTADMLYRAKLQEHFG